MSDQNEFDLDDLMGGAEKKLLHILGTNQGVNGMLTEQVKMYEDVCRKLGISLTDAMDIFLSTRAFPLVMHPGEPVHIAMLDTRLRTHDVLARLYRFHELIDEDYHNNIGESALALQRRGSNSATFPPEVWTYITQGASKATRWISSQERAALVSFDRDILAWKVEIQR